MTRCTANCRLEIWKPPSTRHYLTPEAVCPGRSVSRLTGSLSLQAPISMKHYLISVTPSSGKSQDNVDRCNMYQPRRCGGARIASEADAAGLSACVIGGNFPGKLSRPTPRSWDSLRQEFSTNQQERSPLYLARVVKMAKVYWQALASSMVAPSLVGSGGISGQARYRSTWTSLNRIRGVVKLYYKSGYCWAPPRTQELRGIQSCYHGPGDASNGRRFTVRITCSPDPEHPKRRPALEQSD
jgi:hypothetical protein